MSGLSAQNFLTIIGILVTLLITSGAVAFVFKYGVRLAVLESLFESKDDDFKKVELKANQLDSRLTTVEDAVRALNAVTDELGRLPTIEAQMAQLVKLLQEQVPRNEVDVRFADMARRLSALEVSRT